MIYTFVCPVCDKTFKSDEPGEPMCTGPSESWDDHQMVVMELKSVDKVEVSPIFSKKRSIGLLLMPNMYTAINQEKRLLKA